MALSVIIFYVLGILFLILSIEDEQRLPNSAVYMGLGIFINLIAYYISYDNTDYVTLAYLPLAMTAILVFLLINLTLKSFPKGIMGDEEDEGFGEKGMAD